MEVNLFIPWDSSGSFFSFLKAFFQSQSNYETVNVRIQKLDEKILQTNTEKEMLQKRLKEIDCKLAALQEQRGELMLMKEVCL